MTMLTAQSPEYYGVTRVVGPDGGPVAVAHAAFKSSILFTRPNNATAYTAGDVIGRADTVTPANAGDAIIRLAGVGPVGGALSLETVELHFDTNAIPAGMTTFRLHLYGLPPAPVLDNAVFNLTSAEIARYLGFITLNAPVDLGDTIYSITTDIRRHINLVPYSGSLYAELETVGAFTPAALTPVTLKVSSRQLSPATQLVEDLPIAGSFPALPTLNLKFSENRNLIDDVSGRQLITFTRASSATFIDSAGRLQTAAVDVPRFDHNPTTGESLGLLVEEQRTNSLTYSEDTSQWLTPFNITMSQNQATAPDGASTADQYLETAATGLHIQDGMSFTFVTSTVYTYSVFVKSIGGRNFEIGYPGTIFTDRFARFNLSGSGSVQGSDAGVTASIQAYANGWYRCSATNTCASGASSRISNFIIDGSFARSYAGDVTKGLFIWGAQLEAGAFATSYIPTTAAAVTRSADVASITGANFSSWYRQDEGTVFVNAINPALSTTLFSASDGTANNRIQADAGISARVARVVTGGITQANNTIAYTFGTQQQFALSYVLNSINFANAGTLGTEDTSATIPTVDQLRLGANPTGAGALNSTIKRLAFFPQRLSNSTLQTITQ